MKGIIVKIVSVCLILTFFSGCVSTTMMRVYALEASGKPVNGATVLVNGEPAGATPEATKRVSNFVGTDTEITVTKDGYYTVTKEAEKEAKAANIVLGLLLNIWAFLWVVGPKANQNVVLTPKVPE